MIMTREFLTRTLIMFILAGAMTVSFAQQIADPTRPPAVMLDPESAEAVRGPVLQSIMIGPHRRSAIISGERVQVGSTYAGARVAAIRETEVVLRSSSGTEVLKLYPDVQMKIHKGAGRTVRKPARSRN